MPTLQLPSEKAQITAIAKKKTTPSPKALLQKALLAKDPAGGSRGSKAMRELSQTPAASAAATAMVPFNSGAHSSASSGEADVVSVGVETIICIRCKETTDWADSAAYGRDPFKRSCNICGASYRSRCNTIAKEKKASGTDTSKLETFWKSLQPPEQVGWYRTQKSNHEKHARRATSMAPDVTMEVEDDQTIRKGRRRVNCLTSFAKYAERGRLLGKDDLQIAEDWKALVRNPQIEREQINIGGQMELALELFDRIEVYTDEAEEQTWRQKRRKNIEDSEDLPDAVAEQQAEFEAARRGGQMHVGHGIAHQPVPWDDRVAEHQVEAHELPVSRESVGCVLGPNMARASTDQLMRTLQASEQSQEELADEMRTAAAEAGAQRAKEREAAAGKKALVTGRALIAAKGVAATMKLSITHKIDSLEVEHDTTASMIADSTMANKDTDITELKEALQAAKTDAARATAEFEEKMKGFDVPDMADTAVKAIKADLRLIVSKFVAENSVFKTNKFRIETATKAVNAYLRKVNKQNMMATMANAAVESGTDWSENPTASAVLSSKATDRNVFDLDADVSVLADISKQACAVKIPELHKWAERMHSSQYVKSQKTFLKGWLKKNSTHTSQEAQITVKLLHTELDDIVHTKLHHKFCDLSRPAEMTTDKKLKESGWGKGFVRSISLSSGHSQTGIAAFGLGEIIFGLEGQSNRAYESMVTHGPREPGRSQEPGPGKLGAGRSQEPDKLGGDGEARSQGSQEEPGKLGRARKAGRSQEALGPS